MRTASFTVDAVFLSIEVNRRIIFPPVITILSKAIIGQNKHTA